MVSFMEELLPVGSIVALKDKQLVMIIGYSPSTPLSEKQYDYIVMSPAGITKVQEDLRYNQDFIYINKKDIETVLFIGYSNKDFDLYKFVNEEMSKSVVKIKKEKKGDITENDIKKIYDNLCQKVMSNGSDKNEK